MNIAELSEIILGSNMKTSIKKEVLSLISGRRANSINSISKAVFEIVCDDEMLEEMSDAISIEDWEDKVLNFGNTYLELLPDGYQDMVVECIVREQAKLTDNPEKYVNIWAEYKKGDVY